MFELLPVHEREMIRSFIQKNRWERCAYLLSHPDQRQKFRDILPHFRWLDERYVHPIQPGDIYTVGKLIALLQQQGAGPTVWVISEYKPIDGRELLLEDAVNAVWGRRRGAILSCVPGKLAFFRCAEMQSERLLIHP